MPGPTSQVTPTLSRSAKRTVVTTSPSVPPPITAGLHRRAGQCSEPPEKTAGPFTSPAWILLPKKMRGSRVRVSRDSQKIRAPCRFSVLVRSTLMTPYATAPAPRKVTQLR